MWEIAVLDKRPGAEVEMVEDFTVSMEQDGGERVSGKA
jgi:hypothetical protein